MEITSQLCKQITKLFCKYVYSIQLFSEIHNIYIKWFCIVNLYLCSSLIPPRLVVNFTGSWNQWQKCLDFYIKAHFTTYDLHRKLRDRVKIEIQILVYSIQAFPTMNIHHFILYMISPVFHWIVVLSCDQTVTMTILMFILSVLLLLYNSVTVVEIYFL